MVLSEFAGVSMPDWIDALLRIIFIVALMTIMAFALIYLERKILARFQARVGPPAPDQSARCSQSPTPSS